MPVVYGVNRGLRKSEGSLQELGVLNSAISADQDLQYNSARFSHARIDGRDLLRQKGPRDRFG